MKYKVLAASVALVMGLSLSGCGGGGSSSSSSTSSSSSGSSSSTYTGAATQGDIATFTVTGNTLTYNLKGKHNPSASGVTPLQWTDQHLGPEPRPCAGHAAARS